jgi:hypothetical protein
MKNPPIDPEELKPYFYWLGLTFHTCHQLEYGVKTDCRDLPYLPALQATIFHFAAAQRHVTDLPCHR